MKSPVERLIGKTQYNPTTGMIRVEVPYSDYETLIRRGYSRAEVTLLDDRPLSDRQRKACYAMIGEIAEWCGEERQRTKIDMKNEFIDSEECGFYIEDFSLKDAPMSLICAFQSFLARFIIRQDIPTKRPMIDYVDDINDFVYACLANKKCCVCGKPADLHHVDAVGMGNDRTEIVHEGMRALPLCRIHHGEAHAIGNKDFIARYHLCEGIKLDKELCRIYRLKKGNDNNEQGNSDGPPCT